MLLPVLLDHCKTLDINILEYASCARDWSRSGGLWTARGDDGCSIPVPAFIEDSLAGQVAVLERSAPRHLPGLPLQRCGVSLHVRLPADGGEARAVYTLLGYKEPALLAVTGHVTDSPELLRYAGQVYFTGIGGQSSVRTVPDRGHFIPAGIDEMVLHMVDQLVPDWKNQGGGYGCVTCKPGELPTIKWVAGDQVLDRVVNRLEWQNDQLVAVESMIDNRGDQEL